MTSSAPVVLVMDDDTGVTSALKRLIGLKGYVVLTVQSVAELRNTLRETTPDCILADIILDGESGLDALRWLRSERDLTPVVFMSATDDQDQISAADEAGAVACLRKPFERDELFLALETAIKRCARPLAEVRGSPENLN